MIKTGIKVAWDGAEEYIALDFDGLADHGAVRSTLEWWPSEQRFVPFSAEGRFKALGNGSYELKIQYDRSKNGHAPKGTSFGTTTAVLKPSSRTGTVLWQEKGKGSSPQSAVWKRVALDVVAPKNSGTYSVTRKERQQEMFRLALLAKYACCAITGETTPMALEAAHVIASGKRGSEVLGSGILLRADLHRLYDREAFRISRAGVVSVTKGVLLSREYQTLLDGKVLPIEVIKDLTA